MFECLNPDMPTIAAVTISQKKLKKKFAVNKKNIGEKLEFIMSRMKIIENKLEFVEEIKRLSSLNPDAKTVKFIIQLQRIFRQRKEKDKLLLENSTQPFLLTETKLLNSIPHSISIYKLE